MKDLFYSVVIFVSIMCVVWCIGNAFGKGMAQGVIQVIKSEAKDK